MADPWLLYDRLIGETDPEDTVAEVHAGEFRTIVITQKGFAGTSMTFSNGAPEPFALRELVGLPLRTAAEKVKSWNFLEASAGAAAINASMNRRERFGEQHEPDAFLHFRDRLEGKKVAVIGHFRYLERKLQGRCELYVLERSPQKGDLPDPACEYILPSMDTVFITGCTVANKTLPRLLELSRNAFTVITGPSTPMSSTLFELGADALCGFCIKDPQRAIASGDGPEFFTSGDMVCLEKNQ